VGACNADILAVLRAANRGETPPRDAMALQVPTAFGGRPIVTRALLDCAHAADIQVHVWTINDPAEIASLLEAGVDGIVSDFPDRVARVVQARQVENDQNA
jgi:glycerophosphoryl diester phosphodiesterase